MNVPDTMQQMESIKAEVIVAAVCNPDSVLGANGSMVVAVAVSSDEKHTKSID